MSGEEINTLRISIHNLRLLFDDPEHLKQKLFVARRKAERAPMSEKEFCQKRLKAYQKIEQYKPLLEESVSAMVNYPDLFEEPEGSGVVYAINGNGLNMENQRSQGYSTELVPVKNILAKTIFDLPLSDRFSTCKACKRK